MERPQSDQDWTRLPPVLLKGTILEFHQRHCPEGWRAVYRGGAMMVVCELE